MSLRLLYLNFVRLRLAGPCWPARASKDAELLVRREVAVLRSTHPRPWPDRPAAQSSPR